jgi:hypothetical protein
MTIKRKMTGSGITEKPVLSFDDESDKADPEIAAGMERATLHGWLNSVERECFAIMAAASNLSRLLLLRRDRCMARAGPSDTRGNSERNLADREGAGPCSRQ